MSLDPILVSNALIYLTGFAILFFLVLWISLIIWTWRDISLKSKSTSLRILSVLVSTLFFLPGVFIYLLLRPKKTLDEAYQFSLEEEALLQTLDEYATCPECSRHVQIKWLICPDCHQQLRKKCIQCSEPLQLDWEICPYCETIQSTRADTHTAKESTTQPPLPRVEEESSA